MWKETIFTILILGLSDISYSQEVDGSVLFNTNCTACHTIGGGQLVGPDLIGVNDKYEQEWLIKFIRSSQSLINSGDERAEKAFQDYFMIPMPDQPFNDKEIKAILIHIESEGKPAEILTETWDNASSENRSTLNGVVETQNPSKNQETTRRILGNPYITIIIGLELILIVILTSLSIGLLILKNYVRG
ncbi:MAG: cytochrome c [Cyclobacteriaceae bacterium]